MQPKLIREWTNLNKVWVHKYDDSWVLALSNTPVILQQIHSWSSVKEIPSLIESMSPSNKIRKVNYKM